MASFNLFNKLLGVRWHEGDKNEETGEQEPSGYIIDPDTTLAQVLDAYSGAGTLTDRISRTTAIMYPALFRAVELTSAGVAELITSARLSVVDMDGKVVNNRRTEHALETVCWSPNSGHIDAWPFWEDCVSDYCFAGNAYIVTDKMTNGYVAQLRRMDTESANMDPVNENMGYVYRLSDISGDANIPYSDLMVAHPRFPLMNIRLKHGKQLKQHGIAPSPLASVSRAIRIGIAGDRSVEVRFAQGARSKLHIDFKKPDNTRYSPQEQKELLQYIRSYVTSDMPLVTFGGTSSHVQDVVEESDARATREFQVTEATRIFGIPGPLIGMHMTEWGQGLEVMSKLWYRFSLKNHTKRFLRPLGLRLLKRGETFHFDETSATRGDWESIAKLLTSLGGDAQRPPIATRIEQRNIVGLPDDERGEFVEKDPKMMGSNNAQGGGQNNPQETD